MEIIEIIDPELAMCLEGSGCPYLYVREEGGLRHIAFEFTEAFSSAFIELDEDDGCSIHRFIDTETGDVFMPMASAKTGDDAGGR